MVLVIKTPPPSEGDTRLRFNPWVRKRPCSRIWQHIPVFLNRKILWTEELAGSSPWGNKESDTNEHTHTHTHTHPHTHTHTQVTT